MQIFAIRKFSIKSIYLFILYFTDTNYNKGAKNKKLIKNFKILTLLTFHIKLYTYMYPCQTLITNTSTYNI